MYQLAKYFDQSNYNSYDEQKEDLVKGIKENDPYPENLDLKQLWEENNELDMFSAMGNIGFNMGLMGLIGQADSPWIEKIVAAYAELRDKIVEQVENSTSCGNKEGDDIYIQMASKFYGELSLMLSCSFQSEEKLDERIKINEDWLKELEKNDGSLLKEYKLLEGVVVFRNFP